MAKKKRKQYVPHVQKAKTAKASMRNSAIAFTANRDGLELINTKKLCIEKAGPSINAALEKVRYNWIVKIAVMIKHKVGGYKILFDVCDAPFECYKDQISASTGRAHQEFLDDVSETYEDEVCNVGWIACPSGVEIPDEDAKVIFNELGCWENPAPWQDELLKEG